MCWSSTRFLGQFSALLTFLLSPLRREVDLKVLGPLCFRSASVNLDQSFSRLRRASVNLSQSFNRLRRASVNLSQSFNRLRRALVNLNHLIERSINQSINQFQLNYSAIYSLRTKDSYFINIPTPQHVSRIGIESDIKSQIFSDQSHKRLK